MLRSFFPAPNFEAPNDPAPPAKPWYEGKADTETAGYFKARGWDKDAETAAIHAAKAHREAEKKLGIPSSEVMRVPSKPDDPTWPDVWQRLGMPKEAKDYDLSNVKDVGDKPLPDALADAVRKTAHALNLPKDRAPILAQAIVKLAAERQATDTADKAARVVEEKEALAKNWGVNKDANMMIARNAAAKLGVTPEEINALENAAGYAKVMEMLRNIGVRIGEDKFIRDEKKPGDGVMSKEEAVAQRSELMADKDWVRRYAAGGAAENRQMLSLLKLISGVS